MGFLKILVILVALGAFILWGIRALPGLAFTPAAKDPEAVIAGVGQAPFVASDDAYVTVTGMVVIDDNVTPVVPYLLYHTEEGEARTKQLIFSGKRGCETQAGDLPCIAGVYEQSPDLRAGDEITVIGAIVGDQILVDRIEVAS